MSFVHLHLHTEYSLLDGFSKTKKVMRRAKEMGMPAVAITDHGTMFGVVEFYQAAQEAGIKPIIGLEAYLSARDMRSRDPQRDKKSYHLLLLAENQTGYKNLLQIASAGQLEGFYYHPRVDHEFLADHSEGLICTSGCMAAEIPRLIAGQNPEGARKALEWYYSVFGKDNFYLELQDHDIPELREINKTLLEFGKDFNSRFVATNDTHYVDPDDWKCQDILLALQTGARLKDERRMRMHGQTYYLRSPEEMKQLFGNIPGAIENTLEIAERCNVDLEPHGYHLPVFPVPEGHDAQSFLREKCEEGLIWRYGERAKEPQVRERFEHELKIIHDMGFDAYFLIVQDLVNHAKENNMWYNVRGSGAGSMVAYTLGITPVEPLKFRLIFERFLNPGRVSMPDIDLDIQDDKRYKLLQYCSDKYGADHVSQIITFNTMGAKNAVRDVGRVMDVPLPDVDKVCKLIPTGTKMPASGKPITLNNCMDEVPEFKALVESDPTLTDLVRSASEMEGIARNAGTHAAGLIITDIPIAEYSPLHRPTNNSDDNPIKSVAQFEMTIVDRMGLLKVDFLGLITLTVMQKCSDDIFRRHGKRYTLATIPTDDPDTYEFLGKGNTAGVFQLESTGMTRYLMQMEPKKLEHIIAMVALYRPGPMQFIPDYIARMRGEQEVKYLHPLMEPNFAETYGIPVYQEQIMFAAMDLAGYTASESDDLRKAISKKKKDKVEKHRTKFIEGCKKNGMPEETAKAIFQEWEQFANYGFNKSHAADYGVLAVQTGWLKCHYTVEFMTAILSANSSDSEKIAFYINDCRQYGIDVLPPKIDRSFWDFAVEDDENKKSHIRFGFGAIKNVGQSAAEIIIAEREKRPFSDLDDFVTRIDLRQIGRRAMESLIKVGAMDEFGERAALLAGLDNMMGTSITKFKSLDSGQMGFFDMIDIPMAKVEIPVVSPVDSHEKLVWEKELLGLYVSDHPLNAFLPTLKRHNCLNRNQLDELDQNQRVTLGGIVQSIRIMLTKKDNRPMAGVKLEDIHGDVTDVMFFPKVWETYQGLVKTDTPLIIEGRLDKSRGAPQLSASKADSMLVGGMIESDAAYVDGFNAGAAEDMTAVPMESSGVTVSSSPVGIYSDEQPDRYESSADRNTISLNSGPFEEDPFEPCDPWAEGDPYARKAEDPEDPYVKNMTEDEVLNNCCLSDGQEAPQDHEISKRLEAEEDQEDDEPPFDEDIPNVPQVSKEQESPVETPIAEPIRTDSVEPSPIIPVPVPSRAELEDLSLKGSGTGSMIERMDEKLFSLNAPVIPRLLTMILYIDSNASPGMEARRVQRLHGIVSSYPGNDRFALMVVDGKRVDLIEFPEMRTGICNEMLETLKKFFGEDSIRIEELAVDQA